MPKAKSAEKQARTSERRRLHNKSMKSRIRSGLHRFFELLKNDPTQAREQGRKVVSLFDRAAKTSVLHANTSHRQKTKMMAPLHTIPQ